MVFVFSLCVGITEEDGIECLSTIVMCALLELKKTELRCLSTITIVMSLNFLSFFLLSCLVDFCKKALISKRLKTDMSS